MNEPKPHKPPRETGWGVLRRLIIVSSAGILGMLILDTWLAAAPRPIRLLVGALAAIVLALILIGIEELVLRLIRRRK